MPDLTPKRNIAREMSNEALDMLGHMRRGLLSPRDAHDLWDIAFGSGPITAVHLTTLARIRAKLEGRRAA